MQWWRWAQAGLKAGRQIRRLLQLFRKKKMRIWSRGRGWRGQEDWRQKRFQRYWGGRSDRTWLAIGCGWAGIGRNQWWLLMICFGHWAAGDALHGDKTAGGTGEHQVWGWRWVISWAWGVTWRGGTRAEGLSGPKVEIWKSSGCVSQVQSVTLAGWLIWLEHRPIHQKVGGSIPSQGTCLGYGFNPWLGYIWEATDRCFSLSLPLSLKSINTFFTLDLSQKAEKWY